MAHVYANCLAHPNTGLVNALNHLIANKAKHDARKVGEKTHGNSADAHGHTKSTGGGHGSVNGHAPGSAHGSANAGPKRSHP
jgi:hypothetical protein